MLKLKIILKYFIFLDTLVWPQKSDSTLRSLEKLPYKYRHTIGKKITLCIARISSKIEKTLTKLCRWENKIKLLQQKASSKTTERTFRNNQLSFTSLLQQVKQGEQIVLQYQVNYSKYRDDLLECIANKGCKRSLR